MARIGIFGAGWVGLVTGACFAELGHEVVIRDVVPEKIDRLRRGEVPFHEERVPELLEQNGERLSYTLDPGDVAGCEFLFVCVDTPPTYSGDADLSRVWTVIDELPELSGHPILVMKSTVPVGTGEKVLHGLDGRGLSHVGYVSNPEFLAEGSAVRDFLHPDRIVVGAFDEDDAEAVESLYESLDAPIVRCDVDSAEMIKLAANAFLMTRISFINEIANVCEATGADVVKGADAAVIVTEWAELRGLARAEVREAMANALIVDGRNLLDPPAVRAAGFVYEGIGRKSSPTDVLPETAERVHELET